MRCSPSAIARDGRSPHKSQPSTTPQSIWLYWNGATTAACARR